MSSQPRGVMVHLQQQYDPATNPRSPSYDSKATTPGHITTHPNNPQPRTEN
jgi:hypothetical protein